MRYFVVLSRQVYETAVISVEATSSEQAADIAIESDDASFGPPGCAPPFREGITVESVTEEK